MNAALARQGPILELGCGHYSTPLLAAIAAYQERKYLVQASNAEWAAKFVEDADVELVDWATWEPKGEWGLVFLDSEEAVKDRIERLPALAKIAKLVVMHDANVAVQNPHWKECVQDYKQISMYHRHVPWTAVLVPK